MSHYVKLANMKEISVGSGKAIEVEGIPIALFNVDGSFYAIANNCKHRGGPLGEGSLEDKEVMCPWHGWQYDVTSGECSSVPSASVAKYNLKIEGEEIFVELS